MSGRPHLVALTQRIKVAEGGEDAVFEDIADGAYMKDIAAKYGTSRPQIYIWISQKESRKRKFAIAREIAAHSHLEDGQQILDEPLDMDAHPGEPALRKARAAYRQRLATLFNPGAYGADEHPRSGTVVNLNFGQAHLEALQKYGSAPKSLSPPTLAVVEDGEVEDDSPED